MFLKRRFFVWGSSAGFSLTEVMVGGAVLAGVGLAGARMFKDQRNAQKTVNAEQVLNTFHANFTRVLHDANNCNATLRDWSGMGPGVSWATPDLTCIYRCTGCTATGTNYTASVTSIPNVSRTYWICENEYIDKTMTGTTDDSKSTRTWKITGLDITPPASGTGNGKITVTYTLDPNFRPGGGKSVKRDVNLAMRFTQNAQAFKECASQLESSVNNLQADICKGMAQITSTGTIMTWDPDKQECVVNTSVKSCPAGTVVEGIRADGSVHCRSMNNGFTSEDLILTSPCAPGTSVQLQLIDGKLKTTCI